MEQQKYTIKSLDAAYTAPFPQLSLLQWFALKAAGTYDEYMKHSSPEAQQHKIEEALAMLHQLPVSLQGLLDAELKAGNKVAGVSRGWPDERSIVVELVKRFHIKYKQAGLGYTLTNDPHYWYAEYATTDRPRHILVCGR